MPRKSNEYDYISFALVPYEKRVLWDPNHLEYRLAGPTKAAYKEIQKKLNISGKRTVHNYFNLVCEEIFGTQSSIFSELYHMNLHN